MENAVQRNSSAQKQEVTEFALNQALISDNFIFILMWFAKIEALLSVPLFVETQMVTHSASFVEFTIICGINI